MILSFDLSRKCNGLVYVNGYRMSGDKYSGDHVSICFAIDTHLTELKKLDAILLEKQNGVLFVTLFQKENDKLIEFFTGSYTGDLSQFPNNKHFNVVDYFDSTGMSDHYYNDFLLNVDTQKSFLSIKKRISLMEELKKAVYAQDFIEAESLFRLVAPDNSCYFNYRGEYNLFFNWRQGVLINHFFYCNENVVESFMKLYSKIKKQQKKLFKSQKTLLPLIDNIINFYSKLN